MQVDQNSFYSYFLSLMFASGSMSGSSETVYIWGAGQEKRSGAPLLPRAWLLMNLQCMKHRKRILFAESDAPRITTGTPTNLEIIALIWRSTTVGARWKMPGSSSNMAPVCKRFWATQLPSHFCRRHIRSGFANSMRLSFRAWLVIWFVSRLWKSNSRYAKLVLHCPLEMGQHDVFATVRSACWSELETHTVTHIKKPLFTLRI